MENGFELFEWSEYIKLFAALFAMVSPPIIFPLFLGAVGNRPESEQLQTALVGTLGYLFIMVLFVFLGKSILEVFGITIPAFRVAGGLLLLLMALEMMRSNPKYTEGGEGQSHTKESAVSLGIVPLAVPILAGPGAISTLIVLTNNENEGLLHQLLVVIVVAAISLYLFFALRLAVHAGKLFSDTATMVFYRIMGLLLAAIGVEFIMDGIAGHFPNLGSIPH